MQSTEECKSTQKKYHHTISLAAIRSKKLVECIEKRKETEKLEEEGRLLKHRKTSTILREEESHLTRQISKAQEKVNKFQKHLQDLAFAVGAESDMFLRSPQVESTSVFGEERAENSGKEAELCREGDENLGEGEENLREGEENLGEEEENPREESLVLSLEL